jgi:hypothetical protein
LPVQRIERRHAVGGHGQLVAVLVERADDEVAQCIVVFGD